MMTNEEQLELNDRPPEEQGAAALPELTRELADLGRNHNHAATTWQQAASRLRRSMRKAEAQGAGPAGLPDSLGAEAQARDLGKPWPRTGSQRCRTCPTCSKGGCKKQQLEVQCEGCQASRMCKIQVCLTPYRQITSSEACQAISLHLTADTLASRIGALWLAGQWTGRQGDLLQLH